MTISQRIVALTVCLLFAVGQTTFADGQVINASSPAAAEGIQTMAGNAESGEEQGGFLPVSWQSVSLPKVPMPKFSMPKITLPKWPTNSDGSAVSPMAPIAAGANKVSEGTKKVWEGTKEMFSFGSGEVNQQGTLPAKPPAKPSLWQRMMGSEPEPQGPQTVAEFMSQPRVGH